MSRHCPECALSTDRGHDTCPACLVREGAAVPLEAMDQ